MHRLLARQLRKLGLDPERPADAEGWARLLALIDKTYHEEDQSRYTLERANAISSEEISVHLSSLQNFDPLTGLPNRALVRDRIDQAMLASARSGKYGAVLVIDLDEFKLLNDTLGHDSGDRLLQQVAKLLVGCVRKSDTVARVGGDEFVVVLSDLSADDEHAAAEVSAVGTKMIAAFGQPFQINGQNHRSTPSIGATLFKGRESDVDSLLKQADLAMYKSKEAGRNSFCFFDPSLEKAVNFRVAMENDLRLAIQENQFFLHYQAQINHVGRLTGCEVLVRWQHPERGLVSPANFIPTAEATGLIGPIGQWVLEEACQQLAAWAAQSHLAHLTISVNVSALQFRQTAFVDEVLATLSRTGADPLKLKLELTESLMVSNAEEVIAKMQLLKSHGIGLSLDDFGTGYSSFSYLKRMPLAQLKIDQTFVRDMLTSDDDASIVKTIIDLTKNLRLGVIAEGVETQQQRDFLFRSGCRDFQGYFFSKPIALDQFKALALSAPFTASDLSFSI
jgi:diguanylate cyclase (GGDEF)-like protein